MEPVILLISITAIISGTYIRSKKISLERERMRLMAGGGQVDIVEQPSRKRGFFRRAKEAMPPIQINAKPKQQEVEELKQRLDNIETIVVGHMDTALVNGTAQRIQDELKEVSSRLSNLEK